MRPGVSSAKGVRRGPGYLSRLPLSILRVASPPFRAAHRKAVSSPAAGCLTITLAHLLPSSSVSSMSRAALSVSPSWPGRRFDLSHSGTRCSYSAAMPLERVRSPPTASLRRMRVASTPPPLCLFSASTPPLSSCVPQGVLPVGRRWQLCVAVASCACEYSALGQASLCLSAVFQRGPSTERASSIRCDKVVAHGEPPPLATAALSRGKLASRLAQRFRCPWETSEFCG